MGTSFCACKSKSKKASLPSPVNYHHQSSYLDRLAGPQISLLRARIQKVQTKEGIDLKGFRKLLPSVSSVSPSLTASAFKVFDSEGTRIISTQQLCFCIAKYILGEPSDKLEFLFRLFDQSGSGTLTPKQISVLLRFISHSLIESGSLQVLEKHIAEQSSLPFEDFARWAMENLSLSTAMSPFEVIPLPATERSMVKKVMDEQSELVQGQTWFLVCAHWMEAWRTYVDFAFVDSSRKQKMVRKQSAIIGADQKPIEIDNKELLESSIALKKGLVEHRDYDLVPKQVWNLLLSWYGGGPEISREVVTAAGDTFIELYPQVLKVYIHNKSPSPMLVSKYKTIEEVVHDIFIGEGITPGKGRLDLISGDNAKTLEQSWKIENFGLDEIATVVFVNESEEENFPVGITSNRDSFHIGESVEIMENGNWLPFSVEASTGSEYTLTALWSKKSVSIPKEEKGMIRRPIKESLKNPSELRVKGLVNIGNTCYLSVIIQCLGHTPLLSSFFLNKSFNKFLSSNKGQIISYEFAKIMTKLTDGSSPSCKPKSFLKKFCELCPHFSGNHQEDCHEFLRTLLSLLHEDLKRNKGVAEFRNTLSLSNPDPEKEIESSREQWREIQGSDGSVISDFCSGQTRRTLTCDQCQNKIVVFETFMDISLPIPYNFEKKSFEISFVFNKSRNIIRFKFFEDVDIEHVLSKINKETRVSLRNILFAIVKSSFIVRIIQAVSTSDLLPQEGEELFAYELASSIEEGEKEGKPTISKPPAEDWRQALQTGDLVDVNYKEKWRVGEVFEANEESVHLYVCRESKTKLNLPREDPKLGYYRQYTTNEDEMLQIPMVMFRRRKQVFEYFGVPLIISIGNWYTWKDLHKKVKESNLRYSYNKTRKRFKMTILNWKTQECALCDRKSKCRGCDFKKNRSTLKWFNKHITEVFIGCCWKEPAFYSKPWPKYIENLQTFELSECFEEFAKEETIEMRCEKCDHNEMKSRTDIWRLPDILIIHLKRFYFYEGDFNKIKNLVSFPTNNLDVSSWMKDKKENGVTIESNQKNHTYKLYATACHSGSVYGGHYTCYCLHDKSNWLEYDDQRVYQLSEDAETEIVTPKAYVLFYRRRRFASSNVISLTL